MQPIIDEFRKRRPKKHNNEAPQLPFLIYIDAPYLYTSNSDIQSPNILQALALAQLSISH